MKVLVTGGAGCIGSELSKRLLDLKYKVIAYDNLSSGRCEHILALEKNRLFNFIESDINDFESLQNAVKDVDMVFHLAANPDIKFNAGDKTNKDLVQNTIGTYNVLESMRLNNVKKMVFSSSSAVFGLPKKIPTPEDYGPLKPTSLYGASKLACEGLISAFCNMFGMQAWIFRFANVVGGKSRKTGSTILTDFIKKLRNNPQELEILGDGNQSKSYLYVDDCIDGILFGFNKSDGKINIFNLGCNSSTTVKEIANIVVDEMGLSGVKYKFAGGKTGWVGDVPKMLLDVKKINSLGWKAKYSSTEAIRKAVKGLVENI